MIYLSGVTTDEVTFNCLDFYIDFYTIPVYFEPYRTQNNDGRAGIWHSLTRHRFGIKMPLRPGVNRVETAESNRNIVYAVKSCQKVGMWKSHRF